jgi:biotin-(acetyl-CoA carboxylase) ligase
VASEDLDLAYEAGERNFLQWRKILIRQGNVSKAGICTGIDFDGALLVNSETGTDRVLSGTVEIVDR